MNSHVNDLTLKHIPGHDGLPIIGSTLDYLLKPRRALTDQLLQNYGDIYKVHAFGNRLVVFASPAANKFILTNKDQIFSNELGWKLHFGDLAQDTLLAMDGSEHSRHRSEMARTFSSDNRTHFNHIINQYLCEKTIPRDVGYFDFCNDIVVDLLYRIVFGGNPTDEIRQHTKDVINSAGAFIKKAIPGSKFWRGQRARNALSACLQESEFDKQFSIYNSLLTQSTLTKEEAFNQSLFLLIAGHHTTASAATFIMYYLTRHTHWMTQVSEEIHACPSDTPDNNQLQQLESLSLVFKETLRLYPPLRSIPRQATQAFEFGGFEFPAMTKLMLVPDDTCRLPSLWENADQFQPERFLTPLSDEQHWAYIPFGMGAHRCIGAYLGEFIAKLITFHVLRETIPSAQCAQEDVSLIPIPKPAQGLKLTLRRRTAP
ncbi:hypothetical protein A9Q99_11625 [Gammaproteobacteria bacterium 45_16_T64]|nr:hypothetical protein A9Q99_11625 [Gammaproteobacteria bacterium 45_16_T64]